MPRVERTSESHKTEHAAQNTSCGFPVPHSFRTVCIHHATGGGPCNPKRSSRLAALQLGMSPLRLGSVCLDPLPLSEHGASPSAPRLSARIPRRLRCLRRRHLSLPRRAPRIGIPTRGPSCFCTQVEEISSSSPRYFVPVYYRFRNRITWKKIGHRRSAAHRRWDRRRPSASLLAAPDDDAPESHWSDLRATNTWCASACRSCLR